jgi:hypothetical protein
MSISCAMFDITKAAVLHMSEDGKPGPVCLPDRGASK